MEVSELDMMIENRTKQISVSVGSKMKQVLEHKASQEGVSVSRLMWRECLELCLDYMSEVSEGEKDE